MDETTRDPSLVEGASGTFSKIQDSKEDMTKLTDRMGMNKKAQTDIEMSIINEAYNQQIINQNMMYERL
jgi:hypothetical protein